jgi:hypothetical protein
VGTFERISDQTVELLLESKMTAPPERVIVPLVDVNRVETSRGRGSFGWRVKTSALKWAVVGGMIWGLWIATEYDDPDLNYSSAGEGLLSGILGGGLLSGAVGGLVGTFKSIERWDTVAPAVYRQGTRPRRPTVPLHYVSVRGGLNLQHRYEASDPLDIETDGLSGASAGWGGSIGTRTSDHSRLEFEVWRPLLVYPDVAPAPAGERRAFRDFGFNLVGVAEWRPLAARVRPEFHLGVSFTRIQERHLSSNRSAAGVLIGGGVQVRVGCHLFLTPEVRFNLHVNHPPAYNPGCVDCAWRDAVRPALAAVVAF